LMEFDQLHCEVSNMHRDPSRRVLAFKKNNKT
jgi:hypothetical protein